MDPRNMNSDHRETILKWYNANSSIKKCLRHKICRYYGITTHSEFVHYVLTPTIKGL